MSLTHGLALLGQGWLSSVWPPFNAEAAVIANTGGRDLDVWAIVLRVFLFSLGHTLGKVMIIVLVRRGLHHRLERFKVGRKIAEYEQRVDEHPAAMTTTVATSSLVGLPPLLFLVVLLGPTTYPVGRFLAVCLSMRTVRFFLIAVGADAVWLHLLH